MAWFFFSLVVFVVVVIDLSVFNFGFDPIRIKRKERSSLYFCEFFFRWKKTNFYGCQLERLVRFSAVLVDQIKQQSFHSLRSSHPVCRLFFHFTIHSFKYFSILFLFLVCFFIIKKIFQFCIYTANTQYDNPIFSTDSPFRFNFKYWKEMFLSFFSMKKNLEKKNQMSNNKY